MPNILLAHEVDWQGWRTAARTLALEEIPPEQVTWSVTTPDDLFAAAEPTAPPTPKPPAAFTLPRPLVTLAETVIQANDPARFALLYALVWRAHRGERHIMELITDPMLMRAQRLAQSIRRDTHKMRAFLRFRELQDRGTTRHIAWFEPDHYIVEANAGFFQRRFAAMTWSILTPYRTVHWNGDHLAFAPGGRKADLPDDDNLAAYWRTYFSAIFNPARLKPAAMRSEMPKKYWRNLPEAAAIPELIRNAPARVAEMIAKAPTPDRPLRHPLPAAAATGGAPSPNSPARPKPAAYARSGSPPPRSSSAKVPPMPG